MCRNIWFCLNINTRSKQDFQRRFKVNFLTLDILLAGIQIFEFVSYGEHGLVFILSAIMFGLDAILLIWLLSYKQPHTHAPKYILYINLLSNIITIIIYSISRVYIVFALGVCKNSKLYQKIIAGTLYVMFFPMKLIKLYIMEQYKKYCQGGQAINDSKLESLLTNFDDKNIEKYPSMSGVESQQQNDQNKIDASNINDDMDKHYESGS